MRVLPRSLFGRLVLLLVAVVALAVLTRILMFRMERSTLLNRQLSETRLVQLQAIRAALAWKNAYAQRTGAELYLVTQFCFEAEPIIRWDQAIQAEGIRAFRERRKPEFKGE